MLPRNDFDLDQSSDEANDHDLFLNRLVLQAVWGVAYDRTVRSMDDLHHQVLRGYDIRRDELRALWDAATNPLIAGDVNEFCNIFANGLIAGTEYVVAHEPVNRARLFIDAEHGKYDEFVSRFNRGFVDINAVRDGETFLHALIRNSGHKDDPEWAQGVAQITHFVLQQGASIDIPGQLFCERNVTVRQLLHRWQNNNADTITNKLWYTFWANKPTEGDTVYPIIQAHVKQQANNDVESATKRPRV